MNIFVNGCSHTHGAKTNPIKNTYPKIISEFYEGNLTDLSKGNNSNSAIFRETMEYLASCVTPPDKVIIQWSYHNRHEMIDSIGYSTYRQHQDFTPERSYTMLAYMLSLQHTFEAYGITDYKFIVWSYTDEKSPCYKWIDKTKCIFNAEYLLLQDYKMAPCCHFHQDAHNQIAEWVIEGYNNSNDNVKQELMIQDYT